MYVPRFLEPRNKCRTHIFPEQSPLAKCESIHICAVHAGCSHVIGMEIHVSSDLRQRERVEWRPSDTSKDGRKFLS